VAVVGVHGPWSGLEATSFRLLRQEVCRG